jgi:hypothetical protein
MVISSCCAHLDSRASAQHVLAGTTSGTQQHSRRGYSWSMHPHITQAAAALIPTALIGYTPSHCSCCLLTALFVPLVLQGMCMAVLQGGVLNLASMFPPIYIQVGPTAAAAAAAPAAAFLKLCKWTKSALSLKAASACSQTAAWLHSTAPCLLPSPCSQCGQYNHILQLTTANQLPLSPHPKICAANSAA